MPIAGYECYYEVSDLGRVRSLDRVLMRKNGVPLTRRGALLAQATNPVSGRLTVGLGNGGDRRRTVFVHRLVLEAFVGPCPEGMEACHWNDIKTDNRLANLRWDTHLANAADRKRNGLYFRGAQCQAGHDYTESNTYTYQGRRLCKTCRRLYSKRHYLKSIEVAS